MINPDDKFNYPNNKANNKFIKYNNKHNTPNEPNNTNNTIASSYALTQSILSMGHKKLQLGSGLSKLEELYTCNKVTRITSIITIIYVYLTSPHA